MCLLEKLESNQGEKMDIHEYLDKCYKAYTDLIKICHEANRVYHSELKKNYEMKKRYKKYLRRRKL